MAGNDMQETGGKDRRERKGEGNGKRGNEKTRAGKGTDRHKLLTRNEHNATTVYWPVLRVQCEAHAPDDVTSCFTSSP